MVVALVAITVAAYLQLAGFDFVRYDDPRYVFENRHVLGGLTWENVRWAFTNAQGPYWHPLTWLSHMLDATLYGTWAGGHHLTSLLIHVADTVLLFLMWRRLTGFTGRSAMVAALFAVHPLHVESVAWIAERKDVLSAGFFFATLWAYANYVRRPTWQRYAGVCAAFACALMSKPMVVTLPCVLLLLDVWPLARTSVPLTRRVVEKLPLFGLAAAASLATMAIELRAGRVSSVDLLPIADRLANAAISYARYLTHAVWPAHLGAFYPYPQTRSVWILGTAIALLAGITAAALRYARARPYLLVGWLWYVGTLVPVIGLIQAGDQAMADRFTYIPLVGVALAVVWGVADLMSSWPRARTWQWAAASIVVTALTFVTHAQAGHWRNSVSLWVRAIEVTPSSHRAHASLAEALGAQKREPEAIARYYEAIRLAPEVAEYRDYVGQLLAHQGRMPEALAEFTEALRIKPNDPVIGTDFGMVLAKAGRIDEAIYHYIEAIRVLPTLAPTHTDLGTALASKGQIDEAISEFSTAVRLDPDEAQAHSNLGVLLLKEGQRDAGLASLRQAVALQPESAERHANLAAALFTLGRIDDAEAEFRVALTLDRDSVPAHAGLGVVYGKLGRHKDALEHLYEAVRLAPELVSARMNLGRALAEQGDFESALLQYTEATRLDPRDENARNAVMLIKNALTSPAGGRGSGHSSQEAGSLDPASETSDDRAPQQI